MKIDVTKISGYDAMTPEQKIEALVSYEVDDNKNLLSQRNSEIAAKKKKIEELEAELASKRTADEQAEAERKAAEQAREESFKKVQRENFVLKNAAKYISLGYSEENATKTAEALADGDLETVFSMQKEYSDNLKTRLQEELLKGVTPPQGKQTGTNKDDLDAMSDADYYKYLKGQK